MAKSRPSVQKRKLEAKKIERAQIKAARKASRLAQLEEAHAANSDLPQGVDPDLAGIVAGPQPSLWDEDDEWEPEV